MPPQALTLALFVIEESLKLEPALAAALADIFRKPDPTPADWDALRARVMGDTYARLVPASALSADKTEN